VNVLDKILDSKREKLNELKKYRSFADIRNEAEAVNRPVISFSESLKNSDTGIIAEFKRRSPSKGAINETASVENVVAGYAAAGAAAVSVLTDGEYFGGSTADLVNARKVSTVPLLRKDFIIDGYQICEAKIAGADFILLIAAAMDSVSQCKDLADFARLLGLEILLEIHGESELDFISAGVNAVGVNNRNLKTFVTDTAISVNLAAKIPENCIKVSESGISNPETVKQLKNIGYCGFLMGENFMKESDPAKAFACFVNKLK
jgi:indole-3-glycerol phosphate synthase